MTTRLRIRSTTRLPPDFQIIGGGRQHQGVCKRCELRFVWLGKPTQTKAECPVCWTPLQRCFPPHKFSTIWADGVRRRTFQHQGETQPSEPPCE